MQTLGQVHGMALGFDSYDFRARLQPALFVLFPAFLAVAAAFPVFYSFGTGLIALVGACGVTFFMAQVVRNRGKAVEDDLYGRGAQKVLPSAAILRLSDTRLDNMSKARYRAFLESSVPGMKFPETLKQEQEDATADEKYQSACRWLLQQTRDKDRFYLLNKEVTNYGFRRNLYGARTYGLFVASGAVIVSSWMAFLYWNTSGLNGLFVQSAFATLVATVCLWSWWKMVDRDFVTKGAENYARELLGCCDQLHAKSGAITGTCDLSVR